MHSNNSLLVIFYFLSAMIFCGFFVGCSPKTTVIALPTPGLIPIKAYRVIGGGDDSHIVPATNLGCQLTNAQITTVMNALIANAPLEFGPASTVVWDGIVYGMTDPAINNSRTANTFIDLFTRLSTTGTAYVDSTKINVYFTGNYIDLPPVPPTSLLYGATLDPHSAESTTLLITGTILINDSAGPGGSGGDVPEILRRLTLDHEMGHYLGRFNHRTMSRTSSGSPNTNTYGAGVTARTFLATGGEHISSTSFIHLMIDGNFVPLLGRSPVLPGIPAPAPLSSDEIGEVSRKLNTGAYNAWNR